MRRLLLLFGFLLAVAMASEQQIGSFTVVTTKDELTDEVKIIAATPAISFPDLANDAALVLRCNGEEFDIIVFADKYLNSNDEIPVKYKIDGVLVKFPAKFVPATTGTAAFAFAPKAFLVDLVNGDGSEMVIRLWDYQGTAYTYKFKLDGLMQVLKLMQPVCIKDEIPKPKW